MNFGLGPAFFGCLNQFSGLDDPLEAFLWLPCLSANLSERHETKRQRDFHTGGAAGGDPLEEPLHAFRCLPRSAKTPAVQYVANRQPLGEALLARNGQYVLGRPKHRFFWFSARNYPIDAPPSVNSY